MMTLSLLILLLAVRQLPDANSAHRSEIKPHSPAQAITKEAIREEVVAEKAIAEWVLLLDSNSLSERTLAREHLKAAGPAILRELPPEDTLETESLRESVRLLRKQLEQQLRLESLSPSRVTWIQKSSADKALLELSRQTGNPLGRSGDAARFTEIERGWDWKHREFWLAVGDLEQRTASQCLWDPKNEQFQFDVQRTTRIAESVSGPVRMTIPSISGRRLESPDDQKRELWRCECRLQLEPRLRALYAVVRMAEWSAESDQQELPAWNSAANYEFSFPDRTSEIEFPLDFLNRGEAGLQWKIRGKAHVFIAAGREEMTFAPQSLHRGASLRRGSATVTIRRVEFEPHDNRPLRARIRIAVSFKEGGPAFESYRVGLFHRSAWMSDQSNRQFPMKDFEIFTEADGGLMIEYRFENLPGQPADYRFTYEAPTILDSIPAEFHFGQLDCPKSMTPESR